MSRKGRSCAVGAAVLTTVGVGFWLHQASSSTATVAAASSTARAVGAAASPGPVKHGHWFTEEGAVGNSPAAAPGPASKPGPVSPGSAVPPPVPQYTASTTSPLSGLVSRALPAGWTVTATAVSGSVTQVRADGPGGADLGVLVTHLTGPQPAAAMRQGWTTTKDTLDADGTEYLVNTRGGQAQVVLARPGGLAAFLNSFPANGSDGAAPLYADALVALARAVTS